MVSSIESSRLRRSAATQVPALVIRGPSGVGKTTVARHVSALLLECGVGHALVDIDELVRVVPPLADKRRLMRLAALNLAALWENYRAAGAARLIVVGVIESLTADFPWVRASVPEATFAFVRLRATDDALKERLAQRDSGASFADHLRCSLAAARTMDHGPSHACIVVETTGRPVTEIARDICTFSGWTSEWSQRDSNP